MSDPNVIGHVTEFCLDREVVDGSVGTPKCCLHLRLRNTMGQIKCIWVEGPSDLGSFFDPCLEVSTPKGTL